MDEDLDPDEDLLDEASDVAFARLDEVGGDARKLPAALRVVAMLYSAQGVIDNGGLRYFFANDWPGRPPYSLFVEAYRAIGAAAEAGVIAAAAAAFELEHPERESARRNEMLAGAVGEQLDGMSAKMTSDVWRLLAAYARANESAFFAGD